MTTTNTTLRYRHQGIRSEGASKPTIRRRSRGLERLIYPYENSRAAEEPPAPPDIDEDPIDSVALDNFGEAAFERALWERS